MYNLKDKVSCLPSTFIQLIISKNKKVRNLLGIEIRYTLQEQNHKPMEYGWTVLEFGNLVQPKTSSAMLKETKCIRGSIIIFQTASNSFHKDKCESKTILSVVSDRV